MSKLLVLITAITFLTSCNNDSKLDQMLVDVSEFKIDDSVLKDGDSLEILGISGNLKKEDEIKFYNLLVGRSVRTGDTVNILLTRYFMPDVNNSYARFISNSSVAGKAMENFEDLKNKKLSEIKARKFDKVLYDREYIQVDVMKYPAITGIIDYFHISGDLQSFPN